ncbi:hypothetical protein [Microbispora sp. H11081]|uniref:hypothetical protein n=1 Tax=Microbispora sp. H11081 TaxID=2729107 RepID=UPI00147497EA|nr:hypothetical protein [Microbispora sp. H11081]
MTDLEPVDPELLAGFAAKIDPFMQGVLVSGDVEQIRGFLLEAAWNCTERPYFEQMWGVGGLYRGLRLSCCASGDIVTRGSLSVTPGTAGSWKP